mmetsp:Transcript_32635/g.96183  ORF Transcript_32635/g.96183 Transcript_32635/m.96183 type:complete len:325 (-) Transcript_32635:2229-3203(-)
MEATIGSAPSVEWGSGFVCGVLLRAAQFVASLGTTNNRRIIITVHHASNNNFNFQSFGMQARPHEVICGEQRQCGNRENRLFQDKAPGVSPAVGAAGVSFVAGVAERLDLLQRRRLSVDLRGGLSRPLGRCPHRHLPLHQRRVVLLRYRRRGQVRTRGGDQGGSGPHDRGMSAAERTELFGSCRGRPRHRQCQRRRRAAASAGRYWQSGQRECRWTAALSLDIGGHHCRRSGSAFLPMHPTDAVGNVVRVRRTRHLHGHRPQLQSDRHRHRLPRRWGDGHHRPRVGIVLWPHHGLLRRGDHRYVSAVPEQTRVATVVVGAGEAH